MNAVGGRPELVALEAEVRELRDALLAAERDRAAEISACHPSHRRSAVNLVHYVELRNHDVRGLQARLGAVGLSSLGRSEPHVLATIEAVLVLLAEVNGRRPPSPAASITVTEGSEILVGNATRLLGPAPAARSSRIMVTMPSEAADDASLVGRLIVSGMDVARVNCAHDGEEAWERMITSIRSTPRLGGARCLVAMDLAGPKLRTGPLEPGPRVVKITPARDQVGLVVAPALVWLTAGGEPWPGAVEGRRVTLLPVDDADWLHRRRRGEEIELRDSRGAKRHWQIEEIGEQGVLASTDQSTYVTTGLELGCRTDDGSDAVRIGMLPEVEQAHRIDLGDQVVLTRSLAPALPTGVGVPHRIGCTLPEVFDQARPGERIWIDDGKIGGLIDQVDADEIRITITDVRPGGANLKAAKGINLPQTDLQLDALTPKDLQDLPFVAAHADIVDLSFVRSPDDVLRLQGELERLGASHLGIVLKIENVAAFHNLPELLLTAMRSETLGVMIARGDLAVEVGFERLAEVQEEIMWVCEAAHVPVIWATQVLDTLARTGQPSRAEVTDAAMAERAECVMLNKGPHIFEAIHTLDSILSRMQGHQQKKRSLLRQLRAWDRRLVH